MRVTNAMISNNMMLGLNKNMGKLNTLYDQMISQKKIQRPSDDPIILGRSLKLRLNVLETAQYKTNVGEATSWMEISENSMKNAHGMFGGIRSGCEQAANGPMGLEDRQKVLETVKQLKKQIVQESNANYAGRNVFGGYKTDKKVLFDKAQEMTPAFKFDQTFSKDNLETVSYREEEYYRIRLPYGNIDGDITVDGDVVPGINSEDRPVAPIESNYHPLDAPDPPNPPDGNNGMHFMKDTGELIISKKKYDEIMAANPNSFKIEYEKTKFEEGDPNPEMFFNAIPPAGPTDSPTYTDSKLPQQKIEFEIGIGTKLDINVLGKDLFNPLSLRDIDELINVLESYDTVEEDIKGDTRPHKEMINLSKLFSNGIEKMDEALKTISSQQADLGSRMMRLEMTESRLVDDETTYTELLSRTEGVELERAYVDFNTQYAVYQAALQVTAKVVQPTLMDFLR